MHSVAIFSPIIKCWKHSFGLAFTQHPKIVPLKVWTIGCATNDALTGFLFELYDEDNSDDLVTATCTHTADMHIWSIVTTFVTKVFLDLTHRHHRNVHTCAELSLKFVTARLYAVCATAWIHPLNANRMPKSSSIYLKIVSGLFVAMD